MPVHAGSSAYAIGELRGRKTGLDNKPLEAVGFYLVITAGVVTGLSIDYSGLDPIKALFWSAVVNGIIAVPIMAAMRVVARHRCMGNFCVGPLLHFLGWLSTAVMAAAAGALIVTSL